MRYSILFIIVLIMVSGFIAYFGDILGWRLGKKRLSLFNLRPRYTAIVITTLTGMIISSLALLVLVSADTQFRRLLTNGENIFKNLSLQNTMLTRSNRQLHVNSIALQEEVKKQQAEVIKAKQEAVRAAHAKKKAVDAVKRLEADIAAKVREIEARKKELADLRESSEIVKANLQKAQQQLGTKQKELESAKKNLADTLLRWVDANAKLADAQKKLTLAEQEVTRQEEKIKAQETTLQEQQTQIDRMKSEYQQLSSEFQSQTFQLRSGNLIYRQGDEITRGIVSLSNSAFGTRADLFSLLETASTKAKQAGAAVGSNGRAVTVVFRNLATRQVSDDENLCLTKAAATIGTISRDTLVQVVCATNTVLGEQVPVELVLYVNELIYRKGDKIASGTLDGRISEGRILLSVIDFMQIQVAQEALRNGVVPVANFGPRASIETNRQHQIEGLITVVDQVQSKRSKVSVDVYASADIYAADTLNMDNLRVSVAKLE